MCFDIGLIKNIKALLTCIQFISNISHIIIKQKNKLFMNKGKRIGNERMGDREAWERDAVQRFYRSVQGVDVKDSPHKRRIDKIRFDVQQWKLTQSKLKSSSPQDEQNFSKFGFSVGMPGARDIGNGVGDDNMVERDGFKVYTSVMNPGNFYNLMSGSTNHDTDTLNPAATTDSQNISTTSANKDGVDGTQNGQQPHQIMGFHQKQHFGTGRANLSGLQHQQFQEMYSQFQHPVPNSDPQRQFDLIPSHISSVQQQNQLISLQKINHLHRPDDSMFTSGSPIASTIFTHPSPSMQGAQDRSATSNERDNLQKYGGEGLGAARMEESGEGRGQQLHRGEVKGSEVVIYQKPAPIGGPMEQEQTMQLLESTTLSAFKEDSSIHQHISPNSFNQYQLDSAGSASIISHQQRHLPNGKLVKLQHFENEEGEGVTAMGSFDLNPMLSVERKKLENGEGKQLQRAGEEGQGQVSQGQSSMNAVHLVTGPYPSPVTNKNEHDKYQHLSSSPMSNHHLSDISSRVIVSPSVFLSSHQNYEENLQSKGQIQTQLVAQGAGDVADGSVSRNGPEVFRGPSFDPSGETNNDRDGLGALKVKEPAVSEELGDAVWGQRARKGTELEVRTGVQVLEKFNDISANQQLQSQMQLLQKNKNYIDLKRVMQEPRDSIQQIDQKDSVEECISSQTLIAIAPNTTSKATDEETCNIDNGQLAPKLDNNNETEGGSVGTDNHNQLDSQNTKNQQVSFSSANYTNFQKGEGRSINLDQSRITSVQKGDINRSALNTNVAISGTHSKEILKIETGTMQMHNNTDNSEEQLPKIQRQVKPSSKQMQGKGRRTIMKSYDMDRNESKSITMKLDSWGFQSPKRGLDQALPQMLRKDSQQENSSHPILSPMERDGRLSKGDVYSQTRESFSSTGKTTHLKMLKSPRAVQAGGGGYLSSMRNTSPSYQILKFFEKNHDDLMGQISFKKIQDETFREELSKCEANSELNKNITRLADVVKKKSRMRYQSLKRHQQVHRSFVSQFAEDYHGDDLDLDIYFQKSPTDNNNDLKVLKQQKSCFVDMSLQSKRPSLSKLMVSFAHDNRFNYFDSTKLSSLSKNPSPRHISFERQTKRKDLWDGGSNIPFVPSEADKKQLSQRIRYGHSHKNELYKDSKEAIYNKQGVGLQKMEYQLNRQGQAPREDTSVPDDLDAYFNNLRSPQAARQAKKNFNILSPIEKSRSDLIGKNNKVLAFGNYLSRETSPSKTDFHQIPAFMHIKGQFNQLKTHGLKSFELNQYFGKEGGPEQPMGMPIDYKSKFNQVTQSYASQQRYKKLLKNRERILQKNAPTDAIFSSQQKPDPAEVEAEKEWKRRMKERDEPNNTSQLQQMEFFQLLKATGFVRNAQEECMPKVKAAAAQLTAMDPGKLGLPRLELDRHNPRLNYEKMWREEKIQEVDEDFELVSLSSDEKRRNKARQDRNGGSKKRGNKQHKELVFIDFQFQYKKYMDTKKALASSTTQENREKYQKQINQLEEDYGQDTMERIRLRQLV